jgi:tetratricopeptide (TPR) repeat protein
MKRSLISLLLCLLSTYPEIVVGADIGDSAGLPYWCDEKARTASGWKSSLQGGMYHYCGGLRHLNNSYKETSPQRRAYALEKAIGEFNYMIANNPGSKDPLLGEVYLNKAAALRLGKKEAEAMRDLYKALELNPKLVQPYTELASIYSGLKQEKKALEIISEGLSHLPDSNGLQRRYNALGGKLPYPAPIGKPLEKILPQSSENIEHPSGKREIAPIVPVVEKSPMPEPVSVAVPQPEISTPKDTKSNPWCRFCP